MKYRIVIVLVIISAILLAGCKSTKEINHLEKIQTAKKVVIGTSADYPPYEFVDEEGKFAGFDIELMEEIIKHMDLAIEWQDMPFDSLITAVQEGKIDMSISCFNYTEERAKLVDFSDPYYVSQDAFLVTDGFSGEFIKAEDAANFKVGVQSGTVQDEWITEELVDTGLMNEANLSRYERVDQAALDLKAGRIEILLADDVPAKALTRQYNDFKVILEDMLYTGPLNIVLPKGATELQTEVNRIINILQKEGVVDSLAEKYFSE